MHSGVVRTVFVMLVACLGLPAMAPAASDRVALLIGNSGYENVGTLINPVNDVGLLRTSLEDVGFEVVELLDGDFYNMRRALDDFSDLAEKADVAVIYFAGHGVEIERKNYLLPVDAELDHVRDIAFNAIPLPLMRQAAEPAIRLSLVIVDACRDNPFLARLQSDNRSISRGLARAVERGQNQLVAFAAKEGTVAEDGRGANSPYAAALSAALVEPGLEIGKLFRRVRDRVHDRTAGRQEPALYGSLSEDDFFFLPPTEPASADAGAPGGTAKAGSASRTLVPQAPAAAGAAAAASGAVELLFWETVKDSDDPADFEEYLRQFPEGAFAGLARLRLRRLGGVDTDVKAQEVVGSVAGVTAATEPAPHFRPTRAQIREVQARLNILGLDAGPTDGLFGRRTSGAIMRYERRIGTPPTGVFSEDLLARLSGEVSAARVAHYFKEQNRRRAERERRRALEVWRRQEEEYQARAECWTANTNYTYIYERPFYGSKTLSKVPNTHCLKLLAQQTDSVDFYLMSYNGIKGYVPHSHLDAPRK